MPARAHVVGEWGALVSVLPIPSHQVQFHPDSYSDHRGRVFAWEDGLYRALTIKGAKVSDALFEQGIAQRLIERGLLVDTAQTDLALEGYAGVLKHRALPFVSYPFEWSFQQLRDVALLELDLALELIEAGLTLYDSDPANVLFDGFRPVYVDFCSIVEDEVYVDTQWPGLEDFKQKLLYPLILMGNGHEHAARWLLHDRESGVLDQGVRRPRRLAWHDAQGALGPVGSPLARPGAAPATPRAKRTTGRCAQDTQAPPAEATSRDRGDPPPCSGSADHRRVRLGPGTRGSRRPAPRAQAGVGSPPAPGHVLVTLALRRSGIPTVTLLSDPHAAGTLYDEAKRRRLPLLPLVFDVQNKCSGAGETATEQPPAEARLGSEMVVAMDILPIISGGHAMSWDKAAATLAAFTRRVLVIDVSDGSEMSVADLSAALSREFREVSSRRFDSGNLVVCER